MGIRPMWQTSFGTPIDGYGNWLFWNLIRARFCVTLFIKGMLSLYSNTCNKYLCCKKQGSNMEEFGSHWITLKGILLSMEVVDIHGPRHLYWANENVLFPCMNYGKVMNCNQFEDMRYLQLSNDSDPNQPIIEFLLAVNTRVRNTLHPGSYLTLGESMIKSYHRNLNRKIKIIRKPRLIGNEIKNMLDAMSQIVINLELYEQGSI